MMRSSPDSILFAGSAFVLVAWLFVAGLLSGSLFYFLAALGVTLLVVYSLRKS